MSGEKDLKKLLACMSPMLRPERYIFCTFDGKKYGAFADLQPIASFTEKEGLTLVVRKEIADENMIKYDPVFRCITLEVHSSLDAVGLTAAFATTLASHGISANVMAGFYHDHIFVQENDAKRALDALDELSS